MECGIRGRLGAGGGNGAIGLSRLTPQLPCRHPFASPPATQSRLVLARFYCFLAALNFFPADFVAYGGYIGTNMVFNSFFKWCWFTSHRWHSNYFQKMAEKYLWKSWKEDQRRASHPPCNRLNRPHPTIQSVRPTSHVQSNLLHQIVDITMKSSSRSSQPTSVLKKET